MCYSTTFQFKGNRIQFEFNVSILDRIESALKNLCAENIPYASTNLEEVKKLINKHNKLVRFADKSPAGWTAVEEYKSDELAEHSDDKKKLSLAEKRVSATLTHSTSEGCKELKRYGVLFTCLSSRAVHIETANSLETDYFLNALRCFITRGPVCKVRSNEGTNITGAEKELQRVLSEMDNNAIQRSLCMEFKADSA